MYKALDRFKLNYEELEDIDLWLQGSKFAIYNGAKVNDIIIKEMYNRGVAWQLLSVAIATLDFIENLWKKP